MLRLEDGARILATTIDRRRFVRQAATAITAGMAGVVMGYPTEALANHAGCCGPSPLCRNIGRSDCCSGWNCTTSCPKCFTCPPNNSNCWCCTHGACTTRCCCDCNHGNGCGTNIHCICTRDLVEC